MGFPGLGFSALGLSRALELRLSIYVQGLELNTSGVAVKGLPQLKNSHLLLVHDYLSRREGKGQNARNLNFKTLKPTCSRKDLPF